MQLYSGVSTHFVTQAIGNQIAYALADNFRRYFGYTPSDSEVKSWNNSLRDMAYVIRDAQLGESGVMVEYRLPMSSKRLDVMVTGNGFDDQQRAVIVELKQWDRAYKCGIEDCVIWAPTDHSPHLHPSRQAGSYAEYLQGAHTAFYSDTGDDFVHLNACSFLHNANSRACGDLFDAEYSPTLEQYPLFTGDMKEALQEYLFEQVGAGDGRNVLARVLQSRYLPSRRLLDHIAAMVEGNPIYQLLDEQLIAFNTVISKIHQFQQQAGKAVIMVRGAPGTGKSVIAMRIISEMAKEGRNVVHCTGSKAFTTNLRAQVGSRASVAFKYTTSFVEEEPNTLDVLVVDEAHRIREKSDVWYLPKKGVGPQVDEMVDVAKVSVFLLDENQVVRPGEVGTPRLIREAAQRKKTELFEFELEGQFRCSGSEGYLRWLDHVLGLGAEPDRTLCYWPGFTSDQYPSGHPHRDLAFPGVSGTQSRSNAGHC